MGFTSPFCAHTHAVHQLAGAPACLCKDSIPFCVSLSLPTLWTEMCSPCYRPHYTRNCAMQKKNLMSPPLLSSLSLHLITIFLSFLCGERDRERHTHNDVRLRKPPPPSSSSPPCLSNFRRNPSLIQEEREACFVFLLFIPMSTSKHRPAK